MSAGVVDVRGRGGPVCRHGALRFMAITLRFYAFIRGTNGANLFSFLSGTIGVLPLLCLGTALLPRTRRSRSTRPRLAIARSVCRSIHGQVTKLLKRGSSCLRAFRPSVRCDSAPVTTFVSRGLTSICRSANGFVSLFHRNGRRIVLRTVMLYHGGFYRF